MLTFQQRRLAIAYEASHKTARGLLELRRCKTWPERKRCVYKWSLKSFEIGYARSEVLSLGFWDGLQKHKAAIAAKVTQLVDTAQKYAKRSGHVVAAQIETVYKTAVQLFYGAGRWIADDTESGVWGYRLQTVGDDRVRPTHRQVDGVTLPRDHEFWLYAWPPNGWNCRCITVPVFRKTKLILPPVGWQPDDGFGANIGAQFAGDF